LLQLGVEELSFLLTLCPRRRILDPGRSRGRTMDRGAAGKGLAVGFEQSSSRADYYYYYIY
jgi:hypothetical protein